MNNRSYKIDMQYMHAVERFNIAVNSRAVTWLLLAREEVMYE